MVVVDPSPALYTRPVTFRLLFHIQSPHIVEAIMELRMPPISRCVLLISVSLRPSSLLSLSLSLSRTSRFGNS